MIIELEKFKLKDQKIERYPGPFSVGPQKITNVICEDGVQRNAHCSSLGSDTFFSIPSKVYCQGKTVSGYVTYETIEGYSTETVDDPGVWKFISYRYNKHWRLTNDS